MATVMDDNRAALAMTEAEADEIKKAALQKARELEAAAGASGKEALAKAKAESAARTAERLERAEAEADALLEEARRKSLLEREELAAQAQGRLDEAAALIVERIVGAK